MSPPVRLTLLAGLALLVSAALYLQVFVDAGLPRWVILPLYWFGLVLAVVVVPGLLLSALIVAWRRSRGSRSDRGSN